jgi:hypothetical protein
MQFYTTFARGILPRRRNYARNYAEACGTQLCPSQTRVKRRKYPRTGFLSAAMARIVADLPARSRTESEIKSGIGDEAQSGSTRGDRTRRELGDPVGQTRHLPARRLLVNDAIAGGAHQRRLGGDQRRLGGRLVAA